MTSLRDWGQAAFSPRRIALVGASEEKGKAGKLLMDNLLRNPDTQVVPIHPSAVAIMGLPAYATVVAVPQPVDLAIVVTPAGSTPAILRDCAAARVPVVMVLSGGFAETGAAGAALEQELGAPLSKIEADMMADNLENYNAAWFGTCTGAELVKAFTDNFVGSVEKDIIARVTAWAGVSPLDAKGSGGKCGAVP